MDRRDFLRWALGAAVLSRARRAPAQGLGGGVEDGQSAEPSMITLFLCGDVMTGRGIDQILPHPVSPVLHEPWVKDARHYVELAEAAHGPVPRPVSWAYPWGDALEELQRVAPDARIVNLETAVTESNEPWPDKQVHYRMHPANVPCLQAAGIDCCCLANNHILDWGRAGLLETLETLHQAGIKTTGAGRTLKEATTPAVLDLEGRGRVLVFAVGSVSSGIPSSWAATRSRPGVALLEEPRAEQGLEQLRERVQGARRAGDLVVVSIHWGPNWGYEIPHRQRQLAHALIDDAGVDIVHGHSSHHVKGLEVYRERLVLYGCGDFLTDYEGIEGYEKYRDDLGLMYFPGLAPESGALLALRMTPTRLRGLRVNQASEADARWLQSTLRREAGKLGTAVELGDDGRLAVRQEQGRDSPP